MSTPAVSVQNISKCYKLGTIGRHTLVDECQYLWHKLRGRDPRHHMAKIEHSKNATSKDGAEDVVNQDFWALKDVSFDVQPGEVIGIIGRNGAGKSTLLKILTRITEPTSGRAVINGRVGSLLEVGTGFHPELTGRENVFMNGTILGMKRREIAAKFDEIVAFAELEKFIDTPVKRYSSGMYVRLAFAVAAHLEPEILIVDEVLAVGDASFQKRCLGKMSSVAKEGRTILFVSHNMAALESLCSSAVVLHSGMLTFGPAMTEHSIAHYLGRVDGKIGNNLDMREDRTGIGNIKIVGLLYEGVDGVKKKCVASGQPVDICVKYKTTDRAVLTDITVAVSITACSGSFVTMLCNEIADSTFSLIPRQGFFRCHIEKLPLSSGLYTINVIVRRKDVIEDWIQDAATLTVEGGDYFGTGRIPPESHGGVYFEQQWALNGE